MPHKRRRSRVASPYNLPPSQIAYPLSTTQNLTAHRKSSKRKLKFASSDTPSAFSRLFSGYQPPRSGLDDGIRLPKKQKTSAIASKSSTLAKLPLTHGEPATEVSTKQDNGSLSSSTTGLDAELRLNGIQDKDKSKKRFDPRGQTKMERKMQKMYAEWRKEDKRRKDKAGGANSEAEDDDMNPLASGTGVFEMASKRKSKKARRSQRLGEGTHDDDEDPWAKFAAERKEIKSNGGLVGLHDVVQAPPRFKKASNGGKLKLGQGGLRNQAVLNESRQIVQEGYRQIVKNRMAEKSGYNYIQ